MLVYYIEEQQRKHAVAKSLYLQELSMFMPDNVCARDWSRPTLQCTYRWQVIHEAPNNKADLGLFIISST